MLERIHYLADKLVKFAFETTLASRTFAPWISGLRKTGHDFHLVFLYLPNEEFAVRALQKEFAWEDIMFPRKLSGGVIAQVLTTFSIFINHWLT